ncbi:metalloregulator ArsR/SmtB family transcription factor [Mycobacterium tuberculosis]
MYRETLSRFSCAASARFKALADPVRLQLLSSVASRAGGEACVCDISAGVEVSQPTISHHLKVLRDAGLLTSRRRASWVYYAVVPEALTVLSNLLSVHADAAPALGAPA